MFEMLHNHKPAQKIIALFFLVILNLFTSCCAGPKKLKKTDSEKETSIVSEVNEVNPTTQTTLTDIDGNEYSVVAIGDKLWMASNLKVSKYNNGTPILSYSGGGFMKPVEKGMSVYYNKDIANEAQFGKLYNYHAVAEDCLCPEGWQVPTDEDWQAMIKNQGQEKLNFHFGGLMNSQDIPPFSDIDIAGYYWTTSSVGRNTIAIYELGLSKASLQKSSMNEMGFISVRCVKD